MATYQNIFTRVQIHGAPDLGVPIPPESTRRNITVTGTTVPSRPGERLEIGHAVLEVVRIAAPCRLLDDEIGDGARVALRRRAGSILRVIGPGPLAIGDAVRPVVAVPEP